MAENTEKNKEDEQNKPTNLVVGLIAIFVIFYIIYNLFGCIFVKNEDKNNIPTSSSNTASTANNYSDAGIMTCNKVLEAFNTAFNNGRFLSLLELKAVKSTLWYEDSNLVECTIYIQNNGNKIVKLLKGDIYYFDNDNASDSIMIYIDKIIKPNETIKYNIPGFIPKNISRTVIRNKAGDNVFDFNYSLDR